MDSSLTPQVSSLLFIKTNPNKPNQNVAQAVPAAPRRASSLRIKLAIRCQADSPHLPALAGKSKPISPQNTPYSRTPFPAKKRIILQKCSKNPRIGPKNPKPKNAQNTRMTEMHYIAAIAPTDGTPAFSPPPRGPKQTQSKANYGKSAQKKRAPVFRHPRHHSNKQLSKTRV